jgi:hypothetical protein
MPDTPEPLRRGETAYDHFARDIGEAVPTGRWFSGTLQLQADAGLAAALAAVRAAQAAGDVVLTDALPEDDTPFLAAWPAAGGLPAGLEAAVDLVHPGPRLHLAPHVPDAPAAPPAPGADPAPVVCIIDDGIGFLNARFRRADPAAPGGTRTRFHAVWLQSFTLMAPPGPGGQARLGRVLSRGDIDALLAQGDRLEEEAEYRRLNAALFPPGTHRSLDRWQGHGTAMADLAAGADPGRGQAEESWPMLAVQLAPEAVDDTSGQRLVPMMVQAVRWCLRMARQASSTAPVVITIAYAAFAGPKDGTSPFERTLARLADRWAEKWGREVRILLAFGNSRLKRQGARLAVTAVSQSLDWRLPPDDFTPSYLELRADPGQDIGALVLTVTPPRSPAQTVTPLPPGTHRAIRDGTGRVIGRAYHMPARPAGGGLVNRAHMVLAMAQTAEDGPRRTAPHGAIALSFTATAPLDLRAEVQRDDTIPGFRLNGRQSVLDHPLTTDPDLGSAGPVTAAGTHSAFAGGAAARVIPVAALRADTGLPTRYSAEGAPWVRPGPGLAAPGDRSGVRTGVLAAAITTGSVTAMDGTSAATALATRALARRLAADPQATPGAAELAALADDPTPAGLAHRMGAGRLRLPGLVPAHHL